MADFDKYAPLLQRLEGGFVNNPLDRGGATNKGVTLGTFRRYFGQDKTVDDLQKMTYAEWRRIMKTGYWDRAGCDGYTNQSVAEICADWVINSGPGVVKRIQGLAGAERDGIAGPKTVAAVNACDQKTLFDKVKAARVSYYDAIVMRDPSQRAFYNGWMVRISMFHYEP